MPKVNPTKKQPRLCPDGSECIAPRTCLKTKPCWWEKNKREHEIIAEVAKKAGNAWRKDE